MSNAKIALGQRISALLEYSKPRRTQRSLAEFCEVTPQSVSAWVSGDAYPAPENIEKIAEFFGMTPSELIYGDEIDESVISAIFSRDGYLRIESMSPETGKKKQTQRIVKSIEIDQSEAVAMLGTRQFGNIKLLNAPGDNMKPTINPKDLLFVDTSADSLSQDGVYVFVYAGEIEVRRLQRVSDGRIAIKSDNPSYETVYNKQSELKILGRVTRSMSLQMNEFA